MDDPLIGLAAEIAKREERIRNGGSLTELHAELARGESLRTRILVARAEILNDLARIGLEARLARQAIPAEEDQSTWAMSG